MNNKLTQERECPNCGKKTLTECGMTIDYNDASTVRDTWLSCVNCEWDEK